MAKPENNSFKKLEESVEKGNRVNIHNSYYQIGHNNLSKNIWY